MSQKIKAYKVWDAKSWENGSTVVFAKTPSAAKSVAMFTDVCEDADYINIRVRRIPEMDEHYRGHVEIDWYYPEDKKALVALGWSCDETSAECGTCPERTACPKWEDDENNTEG